MSNDQPPEQQQLMVNGFGVDSMSDREHETVANGSSSEPLLQQLPTLQTDVADSSKSVSSLLTVDASSTGGQQSKPAGGTRSTSSGSRPKACSVHIVEPLPTFSGGGRGSRASLGGGGYTVIKSEEKHGILQRAIPVMPLGLAIVACVLNIVLPGVGTLVAACSIFCCGATTRLENKLNAFLLNIVAGILQLLTFLLIVGWIWSISWGMTFVQLAVSAKENNLRAPVPYYVRRHSSVE